MNQCVYAVILLFAAATCSTAGWLLLTSVLRHPATDAVTPTLREYALPAPADVPCRFDTSCRLNRTLLLTYMLLASVKTPLPPRSPEFAESLLGVAPFIRGYQHCEHDEYCEATRTESQRVALYWVTRVARQHPPRWWLISQREIDVLFARVDERCMLEAAPR